MYDISTIDELIAELGGPSELGEHLGVTQEAVSNWVARGCIPGGWHMQLAGMVTRRGVTVNPKVFNLTEKDVEGLLPTSRPLARKRVEARA